jgi:TonB family protein
MVRPQTIIRRGILLVLAAIFVLPLQVAQGQETETKRKLKSQVTPAYPEVARRMNIHGKVKLEITIGADGNVKSMRCLGGHPLLITASEDAVGKWKYEAGPKETTLIVEVNFD